MSSWKTGSSEGVQREEVTGVEETHRESSHELTMEGFSEIGLSSAASSKVGLATFPARAPFSGWWWQGANSYVIRASLLASICSALLGYDIGITSGAALFVTQDFGLTHVQTEVFVGILNLVSLIGALVAGRLADMFGRRAAMAVASSVFFAGSLCMAFAQNYTVLLIGRVITGIGVGYGLALPPLYIAEISPALNRGGLVSFGEVFINLGILLGFLISFLLGGLPVDVAWRWMLGLGAIPAILLLLGVLLIPESPRWLIMHGRVREGELILIKSSHDEMEAQKRYFEIVEAAGLTEEVSKSSWNQSGASTPDRDSGVSPDSAAGNPDKPKGAEAEPVRRQVVRPMEGAGGHTVWKEILWPTPAVRRMLIVLLGINFFQQATGIDATVYYSPVMFSEAGIQGNRALLGATLGVGFTKVSFVLLSMTLLDHFGRRPLLLTSVAGMMVALICQGSLFQWLDSQAEPPSSSWPAVLAVFSSCAFCAFFSVGLGPINWLFTSEIFPLRLRAQAIGLGTAVNRIASGAVAMSFLSIGDATGPAGPFFIFAGFCVLAFFFFFFFAPETKGRSLEQIVKMFERPDYALHPDNYDPAPGGLASYDANRMNARSSDAPE